MMGPGFGEAIGRSMAIVFVAAVLVSSLTLVALGYGLYWLVQHVRVV